MRRVGLRAAQRQATFKERLAFEEEQHRVMIEGQRGAAWDREHGAKWREKWQVDDPWAVLGVSPDAPWSEIKKGYKQAVKTSHPDAIGTGSDAAFKKISAAYKALQERSAALESGDATSTRDADADNPWKYEHDPVMQKNYTWQRNRQRIAEHFEKRRTQQHYGVGENGRPPLTEAQLEERSRLVATVGLIVFSLGVYTLVYPLAYPTWRDKRPAYLTEK